MPSSYTPNYQLSQWEADDRVLRTDFNEDNAKLDAALAALAGRARISAGYYVGNGTATRSISVGFTPKAVLVLTNVGQAFAAPSSTYYYGGLAVSGSPVGEGSYVAVQIVSGGFQVGYKDVRGTYICSNESNQKYNYIAFG